MQCDGEAYAAVPSSASGDLAVHHLSARSVIRVILQFCKENGLQESFNTIQVRASGVCQCLLGQLASSMHGMGNCS